MPNWFLEEIKGILTGKGEIMREIHALAREIHALFGLRHCRSVLVNEPPEPKSNHSSAHAGADEFPISVDERGLAVSHFGNCMVER